MAKPVLHGVRIDIETKSAADIKHGVYRYTEDADFEVLLISYSPLRRYAGGKVVPGKPRPLDLRDQKAVAQFAAILSNPTLQKHAFNANFERIALSRWLGMGDGDYLDPTNWHCTAVRANVNGVFGTLEEVARAVRSPITKDREGSRLIKLFSVPDKKTGQFHDPCLDGALACWCGSASHPEDFKRFSDYCDQDVMTEAVVAASFPDVPVFVQAEYEADQRINDRGVRHWKKMSEQAVEAVKIEQARIMDELRLKTGLENPNSGAQIKGWLEEQGYPMVSLDKDHRTEALADPFIPEHVAEVLTLKGNASLSSVAKHKAALDTRCADGRIRGALRFYGAHTGREAGRGIQPQNLPRYEAPAPDRRRLLLGTAGSDAPEIAKGSVRASLVPARGHVFVVCDYNAIEARVLGGLAGEQWVEDEFRGAGKIYEATAATMFGVNKDRLVAALKVCGKCGACENCETRQKSKVACIAEGELVLTDRGLVPIEQVSRNDKVWDGVEWVSHDGVVCLGTKEVITYDGLTATPDHLVWTTAGDGTPIAFGDAARRGERLVQSGSGGVPLTVSDRYRDRASVHKTELAMRVRPSAMRRVLSGVLGRVVEHAQRISRLRVVRREGAAGSEVVGPQTHGSEAAMHESKRPGLAKLRWARHRVPVSVGTERGAMDHGELGELVTGVEPRQDRHGRTLRTRQPSVRADDRATPQQTDHGTVVLRSAVLAVRTNRGETEVVGGDEPGSDHRGRPASRSGQAEELAGHRSETRVYDLLNAGSRHRFTVSGRLAHNCLALGYAGGAGALVKMGAEAAGIDVGNYPSLNAEWHEAGMPGKFHDWERDRHDYPELLRLRDLYRDASPQTVRFWKLCAKAWDMASDGQGARFGQDQMVTIIRDGRHNRMILPSGRSIWYRFARSHRDPDNPKWVDRRTFIGKNKGVGHRRTDTHGGSLTENVTQAVARDLLFDLLMRIEARTAAGWPARTVLHVHDEVVLEVPSQHADQVLADTLGLMEDTPSWGKVFVLKGEGAIMERYGK